jgi:hypothetical protein
MEEVAHASEQGLQATLDQLLSQLDRPLSKEELATQAIGNVFLKDHQSLRAGWVLRMISNSNLMREKLTLFWHDHFATAISKVKEPKLMADQIDSLRDLAFGNFRDTLLAMARDPSMQIWLDNSLNVAGHPNENWGRELMELFTLGIGHYTETDVREVARAFTGWNLEKGNRRFQFYPDKHDSGSKNILGHTGNLDGGDVLTILVDKPETPQFICKKLWRFFVSQTPTDEDVARINPAATRSPPSSAPCSFPPVFLRQRSWARKSKTRSNTSWASRAVSRPTSPTLSCTATPPPPWAWISTIRPMCQAGRGAKNGFPPSPSSNASASSEHY